jgi:Uma2 family endonuclease
MATAAKPRPGPPPRPSPKPPPFETVADLLDQLGGIPAHRIPLVPTPGTATEADVLIYRLCELIDGVLVTKPIGYEESCLTRTLVILLGAYVRQHGLGVLSGADGPYRVARNQVRLPDIAFVSRDRFRRRNRGAAISSLAPDLAVEVLSKSNTRREMERKLREYFAAGTRLVWFVDPRKRTVRVYTDPDHSTLLGEADTLDGGAVLPGFALPLRELFAELDR